MFYEPSDRTSVFFGCARSRGFHVASKTRQQRHAIAEQNETTKVSLLVVIATFVHCHLQPQQNHLLIH